MGRKIIRYVAMFGAVILIWAGTENLTLSQSGYSCNGSITVSPGGNIQSAISSAASGSTIVLKSGTYSASRLRSDKNNITICSETKHGARIVNNTSSETILINSDNVTIKGLYFTSGNGSGAGGSVGMVRFASSKGGVIVDNIVEKANTSQISIGGSRPGDRISNVKVLNNILRDSGLGNAEGEAIYIASVQDSGSVTVSQIEIAGNLIENFKANAIDVKEVGADIEIHRNVFKNHLQTAASQHQVGGTLVLSGRDISVHDNVILNAANASSWGIFSVAENANNKVYNNVTIGSGPNASAYITSRGRGHTGAVSQVYGNKQCDLSSYKVSVSSGVSVKDTGQSSASVCGAERSRIESQMGGLVAGITLVESPVGCEKYLSGSHAFTPYGIVWDWTTTQRELLLKATCSSANTTIDIGSGREVGTGTNQQGLTYVYHQGYYSTGTGWLPYALQCSGTDKTKIVGVWCKGSATASLPANAKWFVGYTCIWTGSKWQCGCSDATCATSYWQVQGIKR